MTTIFRIFIPVKTGPDETIFNFKQVLSVIEGELKTHHLSLESKVAFSPSESNPTKSTKHSFTIHMI